MGFSATNPVSVGDYILKSDYDELFADAQWLHDDILRLNGIGGVVIGDTSRVNIKQIGRTDQSLTIDILAGTTPGQDAQMIAAGKTNGAGCSFQFTMRDSGTIANDVFKFADKDGNTLWQLSMTTLGLTNGATTIGQLDGGSALYLYGGPDQSGVGRDGSIRLIGQTTVGDGVSIGVPKKAGGANGIFAIALNEDGAGAAANMLRADQGVWEFYDTAVQTSRLELDVADSAFIVRRDNGGSADERCRFEWDSASGDARIISTVPGGAAATWSFGTDGVATLPDCGAATGNTNGDFYYDANAGTAGHGALYLRTNGSNYIVFEAP